MTVDQNSPQPGADSGHSPSDQQVARLKCRCTAELQIRRRTSYQRLRCDRCGATLFVFARNPRPSPAPMLPEPASAPGSSTSLPALGRPRRARRPLPKALIAGIVAVVVAVALATVAWRHRRTQNAQVELVVNLREGVAALHEVELSTAIEHLAKAHRAALLVGMDSIDARTARQLDREAQIWSSQAAFSLFDLSRQLDSTTRQSVNDLRSQFRTRFGGRSIIVDAILTRTAVDAEARGSATDKPPADRLQADWLIQGENSTLRLEPGVQSALCGFLPYDEPTRVIFGATLADLTRETNTDAVWQLVLAPNSSVLLTCVEPLQYAHWPDDAECLAVLGHQSEYLGVKP